MDLPAAPSAPCPCSSGAVSVTRTPQGWAVVSPAGSETTGDLVEGLTIADLLTEELGGSVDPDRATRRSVRGPAGGQGDDSADPRDARIAALERTVAQLEHALAARVSIERAIGVLAERDQVPPKTAFDALRGSARSQGRPVAELAHEVLDTLPDADASHPAPSAARVVGTPGPLAVVAGGGPRRADVGRVAGGRR